MKYLFILFNSYKRTNKKFKKLLAKLQYNVDFIFYRSLENDLNNYTHYDGLIFGPDKPFKLTKLENLKNKYLLKIYKLYQQFSKKRVIGICFGLQLLSIFNGCEVGELKIKKPNFMKKINLDLRYKIFENITENTFCRSHERIIVKISDAVRVIAHDEDGPMAIKVKDRFHYGFQFHPEISYQQGIQLLENIKKI